MSTEKESFISVVQCMDGRSNVAMVYFADTELGGSYPDIVCDGPGVVAHLANSESSRHSHYLGVFEERIKISVEKHGSSEVWVVGHSECAGHPVADDVQKRDVKAAIKHLQGRAKTLGYDWLDWKAGFASRSGDGVWLIKEI